MRRQFALPESDVEFLEASGYAWETVQNGGNWVIIHGYPVPPGYNHNTASVALAIAGGYPVSQIDMAYFFPPLARTDQQAIRALTPRPIDGQQWQQWSRHRTPQNPWNPGVDGVATQMLLVKEWLERELRAQ